jgi:hypothetical protein
MVEGRRPFVHAGRFCWRVPRSVKFREFLAIGRGDRAGGGFSGVSSRISGSAGLFVRPGASNIVFSEKTMFESFKFCLSPKNNV